MDFALILKAENRKARRQFPKKAKLPPTVESDKDYPGAVAPGVPNPGAAAYAGVMEGTVAGFPAPQESF